MKEPAFGPAEEELPVESSLPWEQFAATGSIFDYLSYKSQLEGGLGKDAHADGDDGAGAAPGQGGGGGSDPDPAHP